MTIVNFILDKSGSMENIRKDVIGGFNSYLKDLQKREEDILFTFTTFDTEVQRIWTNMPVKEVPKLTEEAYQPNGGTALFDAVVDTVEDIAEKQKLPHLKGSSVLTVVMTDGEENSSQKHDVTCYKDLVKKLEKKGWTFVYLGANQDSWANASQYGMSMGNTANWQATTVGTVSAFRDLSANTVAYAAMGAGGGGGNVKNFMSLAKDQEEQKDDTTS